MNYIYELEFKVRDYECDLQGIVNNANYQHYMEHTRHEFVNAHGLSFEDLHGMGVDLVVAKADLRYKMPLKSDEAFVCRMNIKKEGVKYIFYQDIYRLPDNKLCTRGTFECVALVNGQLDTSDAVDKIFEQQNKG